MDEFIVFARWLTTSVSDLANALEDAIIQLPSWFGWLPSVIAAPLIAVFSVVVVVRIIK